MAVNNMVLSAIGNSTPFSLPMKGYAFAGQAGYSALVNFSSGANLTATVQVSNDPVALSSPSTARWNNHDTLNGLTGSKNSSIVFPIYAVRLVVTAYTSGTVSLDLGLPDYTS